LAQSVQKTIKSLVAMEDEKLSGVLGDVLNLGKSLIDGDARKWLQSMQDESDSLELSDLVPQYNYWPVASASDGDTANQLTQFTDGGDLENTGVLGMLAQTDVSKIIAFVNTDVKLEKSPDDVIIAAAQASPLFGIAWDSHSQQFQPYQVQPYQADGVNPFTGETDPHGFLTVFEDGAVQFDALRKGLFAANGSGGNTGPAFFEQTLTVKPNPLAGVEKRAEPVTVLWVQNAQVNEWQTKITDASLSDAIGNGQATGGTSAFADFPYYNTFLKILILTDSVDV